MARKVERRVVNGNVRCGKELIKFHEKGHIPYCGENNQWILRILK